MEYDADKKEIKLDKILNNLDRFVLDFVKLIDEYVIVSGYVSILLGRSRATEDVDLLIPSMDFLEFSDIWRKAHENSFECLNTSNMKEAFDMLSSHAVRFAKAGDPVPNIEFKIIKNELDRFSFENRIRVIVNSQVFYISPIELQIAYKLFLGSEKDIEDAKHIYNLLNGKINKQELLYSLKKLNVEEEFGFLK